MKLCARVSLPKFEMTILAIEGKIGDVDLARTSKDGGRIPSDVAVKSHLGLCHNGHCKVALGTGDLLGWARS